MSEEQDALLRAIRDLTRSIEQLVRKDVYESDQRSRDKELATLEKDLVDLRADLAEQARERRSDRRVMYAALASGVVAVLVNFINATPGGVS